MVGLSIVRLSGSSARKPDQIRAQNDNQHFHLSSIDLKVTYSNSI